MKFNDIYNDRYKFDFLELYRLEFLEDLKYKEILDNTNLKDNRQITDALDIITISLNTFIETKNVEKNKYKKNLFLLKVNKHCKKITILVFN